jgi:hypothetical protein
MGISFYEILHLRLPWKATADHLAGQPLTFHRNLPLDLQDLIR